MRIEVDVSDEVVEKIAEAVAERWRRSSTPGAVGLSTWTSKAARSGTSPAGVPSLRPTPGRGPVE
jgi:hypothetical protein